jgi:hypothetical protein
MAQSRRKGSRTSAWVWGILLFLLIGAGVLALNVTQRFRRVVQETNQIRSVVQEAARRQGMLVKTPARKEFSAAFLQMAFGDNQPLLDEITKSLNQAIGTTPELGGDVALMLVTYRAEGELRDVAIHVFGNLVPENLPAFSKEGYWRSQLNDEFYSAGQSMLSLLGREVLILAKKDVEQRQREVIDSSLSGQFGVVENYLHDPVSFIAVVPDPSQLFPAKYQPYVVTSLLKGKISLEEMRLEIVTLTSSPEQAQELALMLSDARMMAVGIGRLRYGGTAGTASLGMESLFRMRIRAQGPTIVASTVVSGEVIQRGLPRMLGTLSRGVQRIRRGPGFPN